MVWPSDRILLIPQMFALLIIVRALDIRHRGGAIFDIVRSLTGGFVQKSVNEKPEFDQAKG